MKHHSQASLQPLNTLGLTAQARYLCTVKSESDIAEALDWARSESLNVVPLGQGSNVVLASDLDALVLLQRSEGVDVLQETSGEVTLRVAAGENWHRFVAWCLQQGYYGLENLALIPGTVGAAPIQNVGAYGVEVASSLESVHAIGIADGLPVTLSTADCQFSYRDSIFKRELRDKLVISAVDLRLARQPAPQTDYPALGHHLQQAGIRHATPEQVFQAVVEIRRSKLPDPALAPNAGSFFKNPIVSQATAAALVERYPALPAYAQSDGCVKLAAAWLIERCGWKGCRRDGVGVHPEHALVLVNYGGDSGKELLALATDIVRDVAQTFGVDLAIEPRVYQ